MYRGERGGCRLDIGHGTIQRPRARASEPTTAPQAVGERPENPTSSLKQGGREVQKEERSGQRAEPDKAGGEEAGRWGHCVRASCRGHMLKPPPDRRNPPPDHTRPLGGESLFNEPHIVRQYGYQHYDRYSSGIEPISTKNCF